MDTDLDQTRMTLRLPTDLREALELAVSQGSSASVTAEIIYRLRKSFEINPVNNDDPNILIKQCAATIIDIIEKQDNHLIKSHTTKNKTNQSISDEDKKLLDEFNTLPKNKKQIALNLFALIKSLIK